MMKVYRIATFGMAIHVISQHEFFYFFMLLFIYLFILIKHFFIVVQLQLSAFSPHPSTPLQPNPPPSPKFLFFNYVLKILFSRGWCGPGGLSTGLQTKGVASLIPSQGTCLGCRLGSQ